MSYQTGAKGTGVKWHQSRQPPHDYRNACADATARELIVRLDVKLVAVVLKATDQKFIQMLTVSL